MNKLKLAALLLTTIMTVSAISGCGEKNKDEKNNVSYVQNIGKNKFETSLGKSLTVEKTTFTVNNVIDVNEKTEDGEKYVFVDYTIKNDSENIFKMNNLNNFYIMIKDEKYTPDIRAKLFAKQSINNYQDTEEVAAGEEVKNYVGFVIPADTKEFTFGYYVTEEDTNSKEDTIICSISSSEWISAPEGMLK